MTSYKQPFSLPYDPAVPPIFPDSVINDEFRAQGPDYTVFAPNQGYVAVDPKWSEYDPAANVAPAIHSYFIDPRRQMLALNGRGNEAWYGLMQDLPVPAPGEVLNYAIVTHMMSAWNDYDPDQEYGPSIWGLLFGDTMRSAPRTSKLWAVGSQFSLTAGALAGSSFTAEFATYNASFVPSSNFDAFPCTWFRAIIQAEQPSPGTFVTFLDFAISQGGDSWQRLKSYNPPLDVPLRQFAVAGRNLSNISQGSWTDFVRYLAKPVSPHMLDLDPLGAVMQQGSL